MRTLYRIEMRQYQHEGLETVVSPEVWIRAVFSGTRFLERCVPEPHGAQQVADALHALAEAIAHDPVLN